MSRRVSAIVELDAEKQRIFLTDLTPFDKVRREIYRRFGLDASNSVYRLLQQTFDEPKTFLPASENLFLETIEKFKVRPIEKYHLRFRLVENPSKNVEIRKLIEKSLKNLRETTENLEELARIFRDDERSSSFSEVSSSPSEQEIPEKNENLIEELVPALSDLLNATNLSRKNKTESPPLVEDLKLNSSKISSNAPSRASNRSFSNRLNSNLSKTNLRTSLIENSQLQIELRNFSAGSKIEGIVSVASNASYFFLQIHDEQKTEFDRLAKQIHDHYSSLDKNARFRPAVGQFCAAMYTEDARWYRARIIRYVSENVCEVFYIDYGNMEELHVEFIHEILPEFSRMPARAIACTISQILPLAGQEGWTKRATFAFASSCTNERVQATVIESENLRWPMHFVRLISAKTQEDIGALLENAKVARRVSNQEICEFWSKKILPEQYVLYNLRQAAPECFPLTKQENGHTEDLKNDRQTPTNNETDPESTDQPEIEPLEPVPTEEEFQKTSPDEVLSEPNVEPTSKTICSSLNPEAEPFISPTAVQSESTPTGTKGEESDDERDSNETPIETDSSDRPRLPLKEDVIVDTNLIPRSPSVRSWIPIEITHIETPTRFYIRYIFGPEWNLGDGDRPQIDDLSQFPMKNVVLNDLTDEMTLCYSKHKKVYPGQSYDQGELVAVKFRSKWHRGRFLQYKPSIDFADIFFVDHGYTKTLPIQMIRPINNRFVLHAAQAHLVHLHQPGKRRGRVEWSSFAINDFQELLKDSEYIYARVVIEPNTIDLMSFHPQTKKWFSFYDHFVKHLYTNDTVEDSN